METIYILLHIFLGGFIGFMGVTFKRTPTSTSAAVRFVSYLLFLGVVLTLAQSIWWIGHHAYISEDEKGVTTFLTILSAVPGVLLATSLNGHQQK